MVQSKFHQSSMLWNTAWREQVWQEMSDPWDVIIIGGGITGAGILREAARNGWRALLIDAGDFGSGTSSRSSKLVHGGLRYLRDGKLRLTLISVRERQQLLKQGRGLITPLGFLLANYEDDRVPGWVFGFGLVLYDLMGLQWGHRRYASEVLRSFCPQLSPEGLEGGFRYFDAQTDDARLVMRVIREAVRDGGAALNYARADGLLKTKDGSVQGVLLRDLAPGVQDRVTEAHAPVVINATGAWADSMREQVGGITRMRRLRGSHLVYPWGNLPLARAITFMHPRDGRPVFAIPWEGVTLFGTTDTEHNGSLSEEPHASEGEVEYLMEGLNYAFPESALGLDNLLCTFAGVRGVIDTGKVDPSRESREHVLWMEQGLLTVTGGKLTTFQAMAHDALHAARRRLPPIQSKKRKPRVLDDVSVEIFETTRLPAAARLRLMGRYGHDAKTLLQIDEAEHQTIGDSPYRWSELRWAVRGEAVIHLSDLLMRRLRLGLTLPDGGLSYLDQIRSVVQSELGWDDARWADEVKSYTELWRSAYAPPA